MEDDGRIRYFDNAATSWPKAPGVAEAIADFLRDAGGNPGRSGHRLSLAAGRTMFEARDAAARCLGLSDPLRLAFCPNSTAALNIALAGFLKPGDRVVADGLIHNAAARPLSALARAGVLCDYAALDASGESDLDSIEDLAKARGARKAAAMIVITHGSNVNGALTSLSQAATIARRLGSLLVIDASQTAGIEDIGLDSLGRAVLAFTGHKSMLGPGGTGGLAFAPEVKIEMFSPLLRGGTGSASESEEQPDFMPDRFESGTPNAPGLAGLAAALGWIEARGRAALRETERAMTRRLAARLETIRGLRVMQPAACEERCSVISCSLEGWRCSELALELDERYGILCRAGLHCAPRAHKNLGDFPDGSLRLSPGVFTREEDIDAVVDALSELAGERGT